LKAGCNTPGPACLPRSEGEFRIAAARGQIAINPIIYVELAPSPLPDFHIGAHAGVEGHTLVTRDAARYGTYFPNVTRVLP